MMASTLTTLARGWGLARKAVTYEWGMWRSLFVWVLRLPQVKGPGAQAFSYAAMLTPLFLVFIAVSAIELPILHILLPWEKVRFVADLLGVYGLFWMIGLLAAMRVHPHVASDAGLRIRYGFGVDASIPWDAIAAVRTRGRSVERIRTVQCEQTAAGLVVSIAVNKQTNVDLLLCEPTIFDALPQTREEPVVELRVYVDDPKAFVARVRAGIPEVLDRTR
jgi:Bacterial PH domain